VNDRDYDRLNNDYRNHRNSDSHPYPHIVYSRRDNADSIDIQMTCSHDHHHNHQHPNSNHNHDRLPRHSGVSRKIQLQDLRSSLVPPSIATARVYRIAVVANGQYSLRFGNTEEGVLTEIIAAISRVSGIYRREFGVSFRMIGDSEKLICLSPCSELDNTATGALNSVTTFINSKLGNNANNLYDIGHIFTTGSGGIAVLGSVCTASKALGSTGLASPTGDAFWVDFVAHEIGHQFGALHTWNGISGSCTSADLSSCCAYEPGSGSTIMGYAGICENDNVQQTSDPYFHLNSLNDMWDFVENRAGSSCGSTFLESNNIPVVLAPLENLDVPLRQPFHLEIVNATDIDANALTYTWEQIDLGLASNLGSPVTVASPRFRSRMPTTDPGRDFGVDPNDRTEVLSSSPGVLNFAVIVRDQFTAQRSGLGNGYWNAARMRVTVRNISPLQITNPTSATNWIQGSTVNISWSMGTESISPFLDIVLSLDDGMTYPITLAQSASNSGEAFVSIPCLFSEGNRNSKVQIRSSLSPLPFQSSLSSRGRTYWFATSETFVLMAAQSPCQFVPTPPPSTYTATPTAIVPTPMPFILTTPAPTPRSIAKVEWTSTWPNIDYTALISDSSRESNFMNAFKSVITSLSPEALDDRDVVIRYIIRLSDTSSNGILVDSHADFDGPTEESEARALFQFLNTHKDQAQNIFTASNGWDVSLYGVPNLSNVTYDNVTAPVDICAAVKCHFVVWEGFQTGFQTNLDIKSNERVIFYWTGDESLLQIPSLAEFDGCNLANANILTSKDDIQRRHFTLDPTQVSRSEGPNIYIVAGLSTRDNLDVSLCTQGLKIVVSVDKLNSGNGNDSDGSYSFSSTNLAIILGLAFGIGALVIGIMCVFKLGKRQQTQEEIILELARENLQRREMISRRGRGTPGASPRGLSNKESKSRWACPKCTYLNEARSEKCAMCQARKQDNAQVRGRSRSRSRSGKKQHPIHQRRRTPSRAFPSAKDFLEDEKAFAPGDRVAKPGTSSRGIGLPPGWSEHISASTGKRYYYNATTGKSVWRRMEIAKNDEGFGAV